MLILLTSALLGLGNAAAQPATTNAQDDPAALFVTANQNYDQGKYPAAVAGYEQLLQQGYTTAPVYFDLANAYLRDGRIGEAIAAYHQSLALAPRSPDTLANLTFARASIKDAVAPPAPAALPRALFFWHFTMSRAELLWAVALANLLLWSLWAARLWRPEREGLRWLQRLAFVLLLLLAPSLLLKTLQPTQLAVVKQPQIDVYAGTTREAAVHFNLHAGTEATVLSRDGDWLRIVLSDGKQGWVASDDVIAVEL